MLRNQRARNFPEYGGKWIQNTKGKVQPGNILQKINRYVPVCYRFPYFLKIMAQCDTGFSILNDALMSTFYSMVLLGIDQKLDKPTILIVSLPSPHPSGLYVRNQVRNIPQEFKEISKYY